MLQGVIACQQHFQAQDIDILIVTTPKSGTTWLKAILFVIENWTRYPDMNRHPLLANNPRDLVPFLELKLYVDKQVPDLTYFTSPRLFATHLPFSSLPESVTCSASKLVYLCRNPMDTFVSLHHFANKLRPPSLGPNILEDVFDMFLVEGTSVETKGRTRQSFDQKFDKMNEALRVSCRKGYPVQVVRLVMGSSVSFPSAF
ncbi:hypothetical protein ACSBR1_002570 [Camellia fascicularis]